MKTVAQEIKELLKHKKIVEVTEILSYKTNETITHKIVKVFKKDFVMDENKNIWQLFTPDIIRVE